MSIRTADLALAPGERVVAEVNSLSIESFYYLRREDQQSLGLMDGFYPMGEGNCSLVLTTSRLIVIWQKDENGANREKRFSCSGIVAYTEMPSYDHNWEHKNLLGKKEAGIAVAKYVAVIILPGGLGMKVKCGLWDYHPPIELPTDQAGKQARREGFHAWTKQVSMFLAQAWLTLRRSDTADAELATAVVDEQAEIEARRRRD